MKLLALMEVCWDSLSVIQIEKNIENYSPMAKIHCQEWKELPREV